MTQTVRIDCDGCGRDLTYTGNSVDYRLALLNQTMAHRGGGGALTCMMTYPAIKRDAHFCGVKCLHDWLTREYP